ncbi:hypothetical protein [Arthrobacter sp. A5]|uniref:hypothetical protein n=1 Tax=Arthrobacter sp. A5 TaxID=576926 RepID=UPI003DA90B3C
MIFFSGGVQSARERSGAGSSTAASAATAVQDRTAKEARIKAQAARRAAPLGLQAFSFTFR